MNTSRFTQRAADRMLLMMCPLAVLLMLYLPAFAGTDDMVRYYAAYTLFVQLLLFYIPAHRFISGRGGAARFGLVRPRAAEILLALLIGAGLFMLTVVLEQLLLLLYGWLGADFLAYYGDVSPMQGGWRFAATVLLLGCIPAYAEEALFRGVLLHSWLPHGKWRAILHSALLFALIRFDPAALPSALLAGILLGMMGAWSGSIVPGMVVHGLQTIAALCYNLAYENSAVMRETLAGLRPAELLAPLFAAGLALAATGLWLFRRMAVRSSAERSAAIMSEAALPPELALPVHLQRQLVHAGRATVLLNYGFLLFVNAAIFSLLFLNLPV